MSCVILIKLYERRIKRIVSNYKWANGQFFHLTVVWFQGKKKIVSSPKSPYYYPISININFRCSIWSFLSKNSWQKKGGKDFSPCPGKKRTTFDSFSSENWSTTETCSTFLRLRSPIEEAKPKSQLLSLQRFVSSMYRKHGLYFFSSKIDQV